MRIHTVEAGDPLPALDLRSADEWQILLEVDGTACAAVRLPSPGAGAGPAFITAAVLRHADGRRARTSFVEDFRRRLGALPSPTRAAVTCSVVICTRRRPEFLADALAAVAALDPAPLELIVVDNDPGDQDCRAQAEAAGARYVREDRPGLNLARSAGARVARGDVVAYLDDDCVPSRHWLGELPELFGHPLVGAVTGPAFAYELSTPAQRRRDAVAGFVHGFGRRTYDWTTLRPVHSGSVGAGANMIFRRELLERLAGIFPPDLDVGTPAKSGGDLYALYRVLAAGYRVTYNPATYVFHRHRPDAAALRATVRDYGVGTAAYLTKALVEHRELATWAIWRWLPQQYAIALVARAVGRDDPVMVRLRWEYMLHSFRGPAAWMRARAAASGLGPPADEAPAADPDPPPAPARDTATAAHVSVVISGSGAALVERCRRALEAERQATGFEVVAGAGATRAAQRNAGARAARGDVLVFLDADHVPGPDLVTRHLRRIESDERPPIVVGYSSSRPGEGLSAMHDALWWEDHFTAMRDAIVLTCADVVAANMSVTRAAWEQVGEFDARLEAHEDFEWGARALRLELQPVFEPAAAARRDPPPASALGRIARAHAQGRAEYVLHERHGVALPAPPARSPLARLFVTALDQGGARPAALALQALEALHLRRSWLRLFRVMLGAARRRGWRQAGGSGAPGGEAPVLAVELEDTAPIPPPALSAAALHLRRRGELVARMAPRHAQWHGGLADEAAGLLARTWTREHGLRWWTRLPRAAGAGIAAAPEGGSAAEAALEPAGDDWAQVDRRIRACDHSVVAIPLPGASVAAEWAALVTPAFEGDRTACVVGAGLLPDQPPAPLIVHSRRTLPERYVTRLGSPFQYIAVSRAIYEQLGGFDVDSARFGAQAPVLDFVERALAAGYVIGYRDTPGIEPAGCYRPARSGNEWQRWAAAGALLMRDARERRAGAGYGRLLARLLDGVRSRFLAGDGRRWWIGTRIALLRGCAEALRR